VLLSSLGARAGGGYLGWKHKAEEAVRQSGLPFTILRPSFFDARGTAAQPSDGRKRQPPPLLGGALTLLSKVPGLRELGARARPISLDVLADAIIRVVKERGPLGQILQGDQLR
jgi:uncharacterized protein YbjT (DUF2867 family)